MSHVARLMPRGMRTHRSVLFLMYELVILWQVIGYPRIRRRSLHGQVDAQSMCKVLHCMSEFRSLFKLSPGILIYALSPLRELQNPYRG